MNNKEINVLIEHVQLNKAGWLQEGIKGIIKQIYGERNNPELTLLEIKDIIRAYQDLDIKNSEIEKSYNNLISLKILVKTEKDKYKLSDEAYEKFREEKKHFDLIEKETKKYFLQIVENNLIKNKISKEKLWEDFIELLIQPLIKKMGAKSFEIITGSYQDINYDNDVLFFKKYETFDTEIKKIITDFFTNDNSFVKKFLLNALKTYYFIEASRLPQSELDKIYELSKVQSNLKIYVDTNFLLSLLDLHDNPSNEAANSLVTLLNEVKNKIDVKFYVFPITINEFKNLIKKHKEHLKEQSLLLSHAKVLVDRDEISGILKKYYQKSIKSGKLLNIDEYFDPYINNLLVILRSKGIELQNDNLDKYSQVNNMSINDDIIAQVEYRLKNYKKEKFGQNDEYEIERIKENIERKFKHDCILWHAVNDKRPTYIDSIKDIKNWIITLDFHFLTYDRYKTKKLNKNIGLCLHPNDLISLLYFWTPRSDNFEKAVFENFRLPFSFKEFDEKAEEVSVAILSALSYYDNSKDLTEETITELLTNQALRNRIKPDDSIEKNAEIIKDEIFEKFKQKQKQLEKAQKAIETKEKEAEELKNELKEIKNKVVSLEKTMYLFIEKQLDKDRKNTIALTEKEKENISEKLNDKKAELKELKNLLQEELNKEEKKITNIFTTKNKLRKKLLLKYPMINKIEKEIAELEKKQDNLMFQLAGSVIFFCENKNAKYYNKLGFKNIKFIGENNSNGVFIKVAANPTYFGIRDRDFLTDDEIKKLRKKYTNYRILEYYCFENYLYHPDNIDSLNLPNFNKEEYIKYIKKQINKERDNIILKLKNSRKSYQEFKSQEETGIKPDKNGEQVIIEYLDSKNIEDNLKAFSLKDFNKIFLNKYNLKTSKLISTDWFIYKIKKLLE